MFDSLKEGEVSKIYETAEAWAIAMKVDERYINTDIESCKQQIKNQKSQTYYSRWLKELRDSAYIEIYTDKL
jgi:parvulin-like peptidyl-prolyl isomerase